MRFHDFRLHGMDKARAEQHSHVLVYRTHPFEKRNEDIKRAFVFVHGILRDADNHFRTALAAAFLANALNDTTIVVPRFASNSSAPVVSWSPHQSSKELDSKTTIINGR